jgi:valyl-tRNA synthetase
MSEKKLYLSAEEEETLYQTWEDAKLFAPNSNQNIQQENKTFSLMMPPPNVTGVLHIGHALTFTLQDIIVRYKRMDGYKTLWQPGMDHAGIATENVVLKKLISEGGSKESLGREAFLEKVWEWKEDHGGKIVHQLKKLGISPDWDRERFTADDGLQKSVRKAFTTLYNEKLIVKGNYMVNWCTNDGALSDIEVEHKEENGKLYHIYYPIKDSNEKLIVATTRPETYFGDTAVMVHPDDTRYTHLVGKTVILPLINKEVTIITDKHVDMEFGTGVVKVTPAHDTNDYEVGKRHDLEFLTIFDDKGVLNEHCHEFEGLDRLKAREVVMNRLKEEGFVDKVEEHKHQVGHCYRCNNIIEPYISKQWFIKKEVAQKAIEKVNAGETKFFPASWKNNYDAWMRELRDWCISRQLWWGHRIPVFYCEKCDHEWASETECESHCPKCQSPNIFQDPDVLDTWFSSALWPFSTLGWGNEDHEKVNMEDLKNFYPNSLLITGFDILFFWVARMLTMGVKFLDEVPFKDVYLHALVRDEHGNKMSKSKGNVIDPLDMMQEYGTDALRFTMAILAVQGRDIKLGKAHLEQYRNFANKLVNATKFLQMKADNFQDLAEIELKTDLGKYMASRLALCVEESRQNLDIYRFNDVASTLYKFMWNEFCDWGIELSKVDTQSAIELGSIFKEALKLLHPFMPYLTEKLYKEIDANNRSESLMIQSFPKETKRDLTIEKQFETIIDAIVSLRRAKVPIDFANKTIPTAFIKASNEFTIDLRFIQKLGKVEEVTLVNERPDNVVVDVGDFVETMIPIGNLDLTPLKNKLSKQSEKLQKELEKFDKMLNNERFVANAPKEVIEENRKSRNEVEEKLKKVEGELKQFS